MSGGRGCRTCFQHSDHLFPIWPKNDGIGCVTQQWESISEQVPLSQCWAGTFIRMRESRSTSILRPSLYPISTQIPAVLLRKCYPQFPSQIDKIQPERYNITASANWHGQTALKRMHVYPSWALQTASSKKEGLHGNLEGWELRKVWGRLSSKLFEYFSKEVNPKSICSVSEGGFAALHELMP